MIFSGRVNSADLAVMCRTICNGQESGLSLVESFGQLTRRGPIRTRALAKRVLERLSQGDTLADSLEPESERLPELFTSLAHVGEQAGGIAETFRELERYFEQQTTLRRNFRVQIIWPMFEFVGSIFVICVLLLIAGMLDLPIDPIGLGTGVKGVARFLMIVGSGLMGLFVVYWLLSQKLRFMAPVERVILAMPVFGPALEALLMTRVCLGLRLTLGSGLPTPKAIDQSLRASASALYQKSYQKAKPGLRRGEELTEVLTRCAVFPGEFLDVVANAEEGGRVPEAMERQGEYYREESSRKLTALTRLASAIVYIGVAFMIVVMIVKIYSQVMGPAYKMAVDMSK